ncbi:MAG: hypothetical protein V7K61_24150 [Nostoc sp.]
MRYTIMSQGVGAIHVDAERLLLRERFQRTRRVLPLRLHLT